MKPLIIFFPKEGNEITLTKQELTEIIEQAYEAGKKDGNWPTYPYTWGTTTPALVPSSIGINPKDNPHWTTTYGTVDYADTTTLVK